MIHKRLAAASKTEEARTRYIVLVLVRAGATSHRFSRGRPRKAGTPRSRSGAMPENLPYEVLKAAAGLLVEARQAGTRGKPALAAQLRLRARQLLNTPRSRRALIAL